MELSEDEIIGYNVFTFCDSEWRFSRRSSFAAGSAAFGELVWIYDSNSMVIEAPRICFTQDIATSFLGYYWNIRRIGDVDDLGQWNAFYLWQSWENEKPS